MDRQHPRKTIGTGIFGSSLQPFVVGEIGVERIDCKYPFGVRSQQRLDPGEPEGIGPFAQLVAFAGRADCG